MLDIISKHRSVEVTKQQNRIGSCLPFRVGASKGYPGIWIYHQAATTPQAKCNLVGLRLHEVGTPLHYCGAYFFPSRGPCYGQPCLSPRWPTTSPTSPLPLPSWDMSFLRNSTKFTRLSTRRSPPHAPSITNPPPSPHVPPMSRGR